MSNDAHVDELRATFLHKRVKPSEHTVRRLRDRWQGEGREPQKSKLKAAYEKKLAQRGTVASILEPDYNRSIVAGLEVNWDDGYTSKCLAYMVTLDE